MTAPFVSNFAQQALLWALEEAQSPRYRVRRTWGQARGPIDDLDEAEILYEAWTAAYYDRIQSQLNEGRKLDDILDDIRLEASGEMERRQEDIERWALGDDSVLETLNLDGDYSDLFADEEGGDDDG